MHTLRHQKIEIKCITLFQNSIFPVPDLVFQDLTKIYIQYLRLKEWCQDVAVVPPHVCVGSTWVCSPSVCLTTDTWMDGWIKSGLIPCFYPVPVFNQKAQITGGT